MGFDTTDEERAFWDDEPRRPRRRHRASSERTADASSDAPNEPATPRTGRHPVLSPRSAEIAAARTGRRSVAPGTRRHGDPTGTLPAALSDIWDDDWDRPVPHDTVGPRGRHLSDVWDAAIWDEAPRRVAVTASSPAPRSRRDVARLRLGLLAAASVVLVPIAFAFDGDDGGLRTTTPAAAVALPNAALATTTGPSATGAGVGSAGDPTSSAAAAATGAAATQQAPATAAAGARSESLDAVAVTTAPAASEVTASTAAPTEAPATEATDPPTTEATTTEAPVTDPPTTEATTTTLDPAAAHAAAVAACGNTYEIAPGDYWIGIADAIDTPLADLLDLNAATVDTPLYAGRDVCLPAGAHIAEPTTTAATTTTAAPSTTAKPPSTTSPKTTTTTAAPASTTPKTTTTTEAPPKNTYTRAEVEAIIREVWPDDLEDEAVRIATRESNLIPTVRNYCCYGLFQLYYSVHKTWMAQMGITSASQLYDPRVNATAAYALYQRSGSWAPWAL